MLTRFTRLAAQRKCIRMFSAKAYENILVSQKEDNITLIELNRPKALNALCDALFTELSAAIKEAD